MQSQCNFIFAQLKDEFAFFTSMYSVGSASVLFIFHASFEKPDQARGPVFATPGREPRKVSSSCDPLTYAAGLIYIQKAVGPHKALLTARGCGDLVHPPVNNPTHAVMALVAPFLCPPTATSSALTRRPMVETFST
jgi:hypothetical protein